MWNNVTEKQFQVQWKGHHLATDELTDVIDIVIESICLE